MYEADTIEVIVIFLDQSMAIPVMIFTFTIVFYTLLVTAVNGYDCNNGSCLPEPENFLEHIDSNPRRSLSVSSTCSNNSAYIKFPDTGM